MPTIDISQQLKSFDGKVLTDGGSMAICECGAIVNKCPQCDKVYNLPPMTLRTLAINALQHVPKVSPNKPGMSSTDKLERYELAKKIFTAKNNVELTTDEIVLIKTAIDGAYPSPLIVGQSHNMLEGRQP